MNENISEIQFMGDGLRYRRKRKYQDINKILQNSLQIEDNFSNRDFQEVEKSRRSKKLKQIEVKEDQKQNDDIVKKQEFNYKTSKQMNQKINNAEIKKIENENPIMDVPDNELEAKFINPFVSADSEIKKAYNKQVNIAKQKVLEYQNYFLKESYPLMGEKIKDCCINNSKALKDFKCKLRII